ncbi:MAG: lysophospholipid acyltransferase family protein [Candidatus Omnitrophota bacterium]
MIIKVLPWRFVYGFANTLSSLGYIIARKQRKIALESLTIAFGREKSAKEIERIARDCFSSMAKSGLELLFLMDRPRLLTKRAEFSGKEHLDRAQAAGKGVILVSAHFGNFPLMLAKIALSGYKVSGIMRQMRDPLAEKLFAQKRAKMKIKTIYSQPRSACVNKTIEALRANEMVFIPLDQNFGTGGVFVNFFGTKAATATGPVVLARRTGAAILPCFVIRQPDDRHKIIFEPPFNLEETADAEEVIVKNIQGITDIIESYIRKYPAEWGWIHRRWKSRPS